MRVNDQQYGKPETIYKDTKAAIEALTGIKGQIAYATDTNKFGTYNGASWDWPVLNKLDATTAPTANDDSGDGYSVNSVWIDISANKAYVCVDATVGAAVWLEMGGSGNLNVQEIDGTPSVDAVVSIKVTNGTLTDNGSGAITLDFGSAATDGAAIHDNVAGEIALITEKTSLADDDLFLIEDSADTYNKKRVKRSNLGVGGSGGVDILAVQVFS